MFSVQTAIPIAVFGWSGLFFLGAYESHGGKRPLILTMAELKIFLVDWCWLPLLVIVLYAFYELDTWHALAVTIFPIIASGFFFAMFPLNSHRKFVYPVTILAITWTLVSVAAALDSTYLSG